jgi:hypothetical protein
MDSYNIAALPTIGRCVACGAAKRVAAPCQLISSLLLSDMPETHLLQLEGMC